MKKITESWLLSNKYELKNVKVTGVSLNMENHGCFCLDITLEGGGIGVVYGGYCLGKGYVGADDDFFDGSAKGEEAIMRIMDTLEVSDLMNMKGKYARIATKGLGSSVEIIGNITKDKWFDYESFFKEDNQCKS